MNAVSEMDYDDFESTIVGAANMMRYKTVCDPGRLAPQRAAYFMNAASSLGKDIETIFAR